MANPDHVIHAQAIVLGGLGWYSRIQLFQI